VKRLLKKNTNNEEKRQLSEKNTLVETSDELKNSKLDISYQKTCKCPKNHINCLSAKEWLKSQLGVWQFTYEKRDVRDKKIHPATFPISLARKVIELFSHKGELVLDPFVGSGTTLIAANDCDRNDDFKELVKYLKNDVNFAEYKNIWSCKSDEETAVTYLIHNWAITSADNNPISLAIQISADKEFNTMASLDHLFWREDFKTAKELCERYEKGFRAFLRTQHDATQELFKKLGIKKVRLYRGMKLSDKELKLSKEIIEKLDRPDLDVGFAIAEKKKISLQPISSFSLDPDQAMNFTLLADENQYKTLIACDMPVERILSTARTGYGCLEEAECVVIGIQEEELAMGITKKGMSYSMLRALIDEYK